MALASIAMLHSIDTYTKDTPPIFQQSRDDSDPRICFTQCYMHTPLANAVFHAFAA